MRTRRCGAACAAIRGLTLTGAQTFNTEDFKAFGSMPAEPIRYSGPRAEGLNLKKKGPSLTGIYRLALVENGARVAESAAFVVSQQ